MGVSIANCLPWLLPTPLTAAVIVCLVLWFCRVTVLSRWLVSEAQTDWRMSTSPLTYSPSTCQAPLAMAQEESAQLQKDLNDIEQLTDPGLIATSALQQVKAHPAARHSPTAACVVTGQCLDSVKLIYTSSKTLLWCGLGPVLTLCRSHSYCIL